MYSHAGRKTKEQLVKEVTELNQRIIELGKIEAEEAEDITEHKQIEEALQTTNYKLHTMVYEYCLRYQRISLFNQMSEKLQNCTSIEETYPVISQYARRLFPVDAGEMFIFDKSRDTAVAVTSWGDRPAGEKSVTPRDCKTLQRGEIHITGSSHPDLCSCHLSRVAGKSSLCIPISAHGETIGMLHLRRRNSSRKSSARPEHDDEISEGINAELKQFTLTVADYIALALANIRLRDSLKQQATRDSLTGLFNRRYMEETLKREIPRAERHETPLGIIMIDIDHFRRFNNAFGHEAGDNVLRNLGEFLQNHVRAEDVACRYGGEEFTLLLPGASLETACERAEELRHKAQHLQIHSNSQSLGSITLSLGVATFPDHGLTGDSVLQAADAALYTAKHKGRNRVAAASFKRNKNSGPLTRLFALSH